MERTINCNNGDGDDSDGNEDDDDGNGDDHEKASSWTFHNNVDYNHDDYGTSENDYAPAA